MSIPYALAIHDDFLRDCINLLLVARLCTGHAAQAPLAAKHLLIAQATGGAFNVDCLGQLTTIRLMRNFMIHEGGRADRTLLNDLASWTPGIEAG